MPPGGPVSTAHRLTYAHLGAAALACFLVGFWAGSLGGPSANFRVSPDDLAPEQAAPAAPPLSIISLDALPPGAGGRDRTGGQREGPPMRPHSGPAAGHEAELHAPTRHSPALSPVPAPAAAPAPAPAPAPVPAPPKGDPSPAGDKVEAGTLTCNRDRSIAGKIRHNLLGAEWVWPEQIPEVGDPEGWFQGQEGPSIALMDMILAHEDSAATHHVLDVGSNLGYYTLVAGRRGYRTIGVDVQLKCIRLASCAALWNNYTGHEFFHRFAGERADEEAGRTINADDDLCSGLTTMAERPDDSFGGEKTFSKVKALDVGRLVESRKLKLAFVKIDTEGYEVHVIRSLMPLYARREIKHLLVEFSPGQWGQFGMNWEVSLPLFRELYEKHGATIYHVLGFKKYVGREDFRLSNYLVHFPTFEALEDEIRTVHVENFWITTHPEEIIKFKW